MTRPGGRLTRDRLRELLAGEAPEAASPPVAATVEVGTDEELVVDWLTRLHLLMGVPFNYLVADIDMLPAESIRFFQVDDNWVQALLDGAYSVGFAAASQPAAAQARPAFMQAAAGRAHAAAHRNALLAGVRSRLGPGGPDQRFETPKPHIENPAPLALTGFLLRSQVVTGWPGLEVHGQDAAGTPLQLVRMEVVAPAVLFVIFSGTLASVMIQEPSEAVHFGVDGNPGSWDKELRYAAGEDVGEYFPDPGISVPVTLRPVPEPIVPLDDLSVVINAQLQASPSPPTTFTAAQFALEMVEGVQAVTFELKSSS